MLLFIFQHRYIYVYIDAQIIGGARALTRAQRYLRYSSSHFQARYYATWASYRIHLYEISSHPQPEIFFAQKYFDFIIEIFLRF